MSRSLTIRLLETGADVLDARSGEFVASFKDQDVAAAVAYALALDDKTIRANHPMRAVTSVVNHQMGGQWFVIDDDPIDRNCVAIFAQRADADLFVAFMAPTS